MTFISYFHTINNRNPHFISLFWFSAFSHITMKQAMAILALPDIWSAQKFYKTEILRSNWEHNLWTEAAHLKVHRGISDTWCLQKSLKDPIVFSVTKGEFWSSALQILLSHLGVACLPRRCQRSVSCYTALVSVIYTSQVRQSWQDYYNIWCDVAFYYHHLTAPFSSSCENGRGAIWFIWLGCIWGLGEKIYTCLGS